MYFSYGFPRALNSGVAGEEEAIYCCHNSPEFLVLVFSSTVQVWSGSQHRLKLGEAHRSTDQLQEEGPNVQAHWCPQKRVLAVATLHNHLQLYALNVSSEALWRLPDGQEVRRVNIYLSHSIHLDYGAVRIADLGGDAKSMLVALSNGTMQVFSWQGKLRGQSNPFIAAYEGSRSRRQQARSASVNLNVSANMVMHASPFSSSGSQLSVSASNGSLIPQAAAGPAPPSRTSSEAEINGVGISSMAARILEAADSLPLPTPDQPAEVAVKRIHYSPPARMLAVVLRDGRCALCRTADSGIHPAEQLQLFRWVYKPAGLEAPAAVAVAINPTAQLLALGLSHGRVAIYTLQSLLSVRHARTSSSSSTARQQGGDPASASGGSGAGQPEPARLLSLADWGYRSSVVGAAWMLRWSPDGRVLAVGYAERGVAVWTPSGCRLMCSLRQAIATSSVSGVGSQPSTTNLPPMPLPAPGDGASSGAAMLGQEPRDITSSTSACPAGSVGKSSAAGSGLVSQSSLLNPSQAPEPGVLEGGVCALTWSAHGYQLLVCEAGQAGRLHQLEFARHVQGSHRVVQPAAASGITGGGMEEVQALQAADRVLLITETRQAVSPALRVPPAAGEQPDGEAAVVRPDLAVQHVKLPQQYIEAAYPLLHAAISQDCADVAVAGTRGLALYSRRARRWRLFGDATQERSLRVQGLLWLPAGIIAACAYVDGKDGASSPQLLLYPHYHLDNSSLLARLPLKQVPVAMDSAGWHMVLAFAPLEVRLYRVTVEGALGPSSRPLARLTMLRELSIMGLGNPLQEIALVDPCSTPHTDPPPSTGPAQPQPQDRAQQQGQQQQQQQQQQQGNGSSDSAWPQLRVSTQPRQLPGTSPSGVEGSSSLGVPRHCVMLRAGGIMSKLDLQEGSEVLLSDAIERFWLPTSVAAAGGGVPATSSARISRVSSSGLVASATGMAPAAGFGAGSDGGNGSGSLSRTASSSTTGLGRATSESELPQVSYHARLEHHAAQHPQHAQEEVAYLEPRHLPRVEMPWWTYGARGMQLWFPSSLSEPLTPLMRSPSLSTMSIASPTATGLTAAAAAATTNSTDPELEFDREVYPIGVSLAEVSIVGVVQRTTRSAAFPPSAPQSLCFHPLPESQPVLPCLLRRLLQKGRSDDALELARWHSSGPHFDRSLEWLLFTALEIDAEQRHAAAPASGSSSSSSHGGGRPARQRFNSPYGITVGGLQAAEQAANQAAAAGSSSQAATHRRSNDGPVSPHSVGLLSAAALAQRRAGPLLVAAARLISQFPQFPEIVVSVARKTDAALWPALFAAVGSPARLCQGLLQTEKLQSAACCLVIVEQIEGSTSAQAQALQLMQAALEAGQYSLAADLLRFLVPPGESGWALDSAAEVPDGRGEPLGAADGVHAPHQQQRQPEELAAATMGQSVDGNTASSSPQQEQQQEEQQQSSSSWFWGLFVGGGVGSMSAADTQRPASAAAATNEEARQMAAGPAAESGAMQEEEEGSGATAAEAWRLTAHHAWHLLDAGALREAAQLSRSLAELRGGLPVLLAATAEEVPMARAHLTPSAPAIASALFVAANEFASADQEPEAALAAGQLLTACQKAGCVNVAVSLALLLGDHSVLGGFMQRHPDVWTDLHNLVANDVHLCGYAPMLSPLGPPIAAP